MTDAGRRAGEERSAAILVVEDDFRTADTVALYLRHAGFQVAVAHDGEVGLERALRESFDLVVLDRMLPGVDGDRICARIRSSSAVPIIMVTARVGERERLEGFDLGADDYLVKPFSPRELVARVRAILRRAELRAERDRGVVRAGSLSLDPEAAEAWDGGRRLDLSPTEFRLLQTLAAAPGRVFSRRELIDRALPGEGSATERTVDAHVKNLRRKLDPPDATRSRIRTVLGRGYQLPRDDPRA